MNGNNDPRPCRRCKTPTILTMRKDPLCESCYEQHISQRVAKALGKPYRELRDRIGNAPNAKAKYLLGLSFGHSSAAMVQVLDKNLQSLHERKLRVAYEVHVIHVDTHLSRTSTSTSPAGSEASQLLEKYKERYTNLSMRCVPLSDALMLDTIDWSVLPALQKDLEPAQQVRAMLETLPSVTSRVDILRLLVRHLLLSVAMKEDCHALLLGYTTTALAELTLAETAKGRGFAVPWQVIDGSVPVTTFPREHAKDDHTANETQKKTFPVYYLLRDVFRREVTAYTGLVQPPIRDMIQDVGPSSCAIVSHKEVSIEDVMARYFEEMEESYPSVVANVVRTSGKLMRVNEGDACAVCGMHLDAQGDARWKGEIGEDPDDSKRMETAGQMCYGCERSIYG